MLVTRRNVGSEREDFREEEGFQPDGGSSPHFCKELRDFKAGSRKFHEFIANTEAVHNPRLLDAGKDRKSLESIVESACVLSRSKDCSNPSSYDLSRDEMEEIRAIVDEIISTNKQVSEYPGTMKVEFEVVYLTMYNYNTKNISIVPLFKVYGRKPVFINKARSKYASLLEFLDKNDLPHALVCAAREGSTKTYEIDPTINKYPLVFFTINTSPRSRVSSTSLFLSWGIGGIASVLFNFVVQGPWKCVCYFISLAVTIIGEGIKYFIDTTVDYNCMVTTSLKYKFIKGLDKMSLYLTMFGTAMNFVTSYAFWFPLQNNVTFVKVDSCVRALAVFGNISSCSGITDVFTPECSLLKHALSPDNFLSLLSIGRHYINDLTIKFPTYVKNKANLKVVLETIWNIVEIISKYCMSLNLGMGNNKESWTYSVCKLAACWILSKICDKLKTNYIDGRLTKSKANEILRLTDNDCSLKRFCELNERKGQKKTETTKPSPSPTVLKDLNIDDILNEENIKDIVKKYKDEQKGKSDSCEIVHLKSHENMSMHLSIHPIAVTIEKLLDGLDGRGEVQKVDDDHFEISSDEKTITIYTYKSGSNEELHFIHINPKRTEVATYTPHNWRNNNLRVRRVQERI